MTLVLLIALPAVLAGAAMAWSGDRGRPWLPPLAGAAHAVLVASTWLARPAPAAGGLLGLDEPGLLVLTLVSALFLGCSLYGVEYLQLRPERDNRTFTACLLALLSAMTLVATSRHMGLFWVGMEATTLAGAPLIYFNHNERSLEATWKYLILCSVGIALALLGTFFLALSAAGLGAGDPLSLDGLLARASRLSVPWLKGAFVFGLVGYGTKMGLAPLHSWKPDAYGEAPGLAGAMLAGGMTSCAFLGVLRLLQVCSAAGQGAFARGLLAALGLVSLATAAGFVLGQRDYKRMLAYSSVEHAGLLALGAGLGGPGVFAALLHMLANGLAKGVLFLSAGNIHRAYGSKSVDGVSGALRRLPLSASLLLVGFLAATGSPPSAAFLSEFALVRAAVGLGRWGVAAAFAAFSAAVFVGMALVVLPVVGGEPPTEAGRRGPGDTTSAVLAPAMFAAALVGLGLWLPGPLVSALQASAGLIGGGR